MTPTPPRTHREQLGVCGLVLLLCVAWADGCHFSYAEQVGTPERNAIGNAAILTPVARDSDDQPELADSPGLVVGDNLRPGTFMFAECTVRATNGGKIARFWSASDNVDFGPNGPGKGTMLTFTADDGDIWIGLTIARTDKDGEPLEPLTFRETRKVGPEQPPPPPRPLSELAGPQAKALGAVYQRLSQLTFAGLADFHKVEAVGLSEAKLADNAAVPAIAERLSKIEPFDLAALTADLKAIVAELGATPPSPEPPGPVIPVAGLRVLIVEESLDRGKLPTSQLAVLGSKAVRDYIEGRGGQLRIIDDDSAPHLLSSEWQAIRAAVTLPSPAWVVYTALGGTPEPLPASVDEALNKLQRVAP